MRRGTTLPELVLGLVIAGILGAIAVNRGAVIRDRLRVRSAATEAVSTFALARRWSMSHAARTAVTIDTASATLAVSSYADTITRRQLGATHGVTLTASRDSMAYAPNGLGYGASNLTVVLQRGVAAETIFVSRLGRVRR